MQYKSLAFVLFSTVALASADVEKRADGSSLNVADVTSIPSAITLPDTDGLPTSIPSSILSVLETAVPASVLDNIATNSAYRSSYISAIEAGSTPAWYSSLPADVKSYVSTAVINTDAASATASTITGSSGTSTGSTAKSTNAAPAPVPTGFIAGSVAGLGSVLAIALAL